MSRVVKKPDIRRQELVEIAMMQFIELGYEKTSIRSIVKSAGGRIGMFYHYFSSKEEIFKEVLQFFNSQYIAGITTIIESEKDNGFLDLTDKIITHLFSVLPDYKNMQPEKVDLALLSILHQSSMSALHPIFTQVIAEYIEKKEIKPPDVELCLLVDFILFGISGIIHDRNVSDIKIKRDSIKKLLIKQLNMGEE